MAEFLKSAFCVRRRISCILQEMGLLRLHFARYAVSVHESNRSKHDRTCFKAKRAVALRKQASNLEAYESPLRNAFTNTGTRTRSTKPKLPAGQLARRDCLHRGVDDGSRRR